MIQISDKLGQYSRNISNGTEELKAASGMQKVVSTVEELSAGRVFEGTVKSVKGGRVTLALSDGQLVMARLAGKVSLTAGAPMFFQVKSNDGLVIEIKPYTGAGSVGNPILMNALTQAKVPVTDRNLKMVDAMMKEKMPIDKQSVANMARTVNANLRVEVGSVVSMTKLGLPISEEMAAQFENYTAEKHVILEKMDLAMDQMTDLCSLEELTPKQAVQVNQKLLDIVLTEPKLDIEHSDMQSAQKEIQAVQNMNAEGSNFTQSVQTYKDTIMSAIGQTGKNSSIAAQNAETVQNNMPNMHTIFGGEVVQNNQKRFDAFVMDENEVFSKQTQSLVLSDVLSEEQLADLSRIMERFPVLVENDTLFPQAMDEEIFVDTMDEEAIPKDLMAEETANEQSSKKMVTLDKDMDVVKFLRTVSETFFENQETGLDEVKKLFGSKEYKRLFKNVIEREWLLEPEQLKEEKKISQFYEKLNVQMKQTEQVLHEEGIVKSPFSETAAEVHNNVEFMNQLNQIYTYLQIPLKMSGQNANGELYVYTNKKNLNNPDMELSAFLHLDLENLGSTDISIKMQRKNVKTNFYIADDKAYDLVEMYLPMLEKKIKEKGYQCAMTMTKEQKKINFGDDFLRKDMPSQSVLHRYSFDVRA